MLDPRPEIRGRGVRKRRWGWSMRSCDWFECDAAASSAIDVDGDGDARTMWFCAQHRVEWQRMVNEQRIDEVGELLDASQQHAADLWLTE